MRTLAIDAHDFSSIRRDGKIYVDKTEFIYRLVGLSFDSKTRHLVDFAAVWYGGKEAGTTETRRSENA
ncbi:MAG: hypothetical protein IJI54_08640 [Kiritimatiellae bacterium]|nr:hypothetical protein [Kiritimatiellia bacterium]